MKTIFNDEGDYDLIQLVSDEGDEVFCEYNRSEDYFDFPTGQLKTHEVLEIGPFIDWVIETYHK